jgi:hypothetical protein
MAARVVHHGEQGIAGAAPDQLAFFLFYFLALGRCIRGRLLQFRVLRPGLFQDRISGSASYQEGEVLMRRRGLSLRQDLPTDSWQSLPLDSGRFNTLSGSSPLGGSVRKQPWPRDEIA